MIILNIDILCFMHSRISMNSSPNTFLILTPDFFRVMKLSKIVFYFPLNCLNKDRRPNTSVVSYILKTVAKII